MVEKILKNMSQVIVGKEDISKLIVTSLLAGGHVLIEDVPGVGKTTFANVLSKSIDCKFSRIQFTPDTMPSDITGTSIYNYEKHVFEYIEGAIMSHIVLADEINRTSPKTQASLLEAMEEGHVSVDGKIYDLPQPFMVIATQNPIVQRGTYYLPESQLDRFMMKITVGYPEKNEEIQIVKNMLQGIQAGNVKAVVTVDDIMLMKKQMEKVKISERLIEYATECVRRTRTHELLQLGASPRALLAWIKAAKAYAYIEGREYVTPDDLKYLAPYVISHRLLVEQYSTKNSVNANDIVKEIIGKVSVPLGK